MTPFLTVPNLSLHADLVHGFTTRAFGADYAKIAAALAPKMNITAAQVFRLEQTHSNTVVVIDDRSDPAKLPTGDALITKHPGIVIGVKTADCLPILVFDRKAKVVAAIHAGWRGLAAGIVQKTLGILLRECGCQLQTLEFAFGPCISPARFEVGDEVIEKFRETFGVRFAYKKHPSEKARLDLSGTARMSCEDIGFYHRNLSEVGLCTFERNDLFYSHRREPGAGRQFNFIGMV